MGWLAEILGFGRGRDDPFGVAQAKLYSSTSVDPKLGDLCERSLGAHAFEVHGVVDTNKHLISFTHDGLSYVGLIEVQNSGGLGSALIVNAVYRVGSEGLSAKIEGIRKAYG